MNFFYSKQYCVCNKLFVHHLPYTIPIIQLLPILRSIMSLSMFEDVDQFRVQQPIIRIIHYNIIIVKIKRMRIRQERGLNHQINPQQHSSSNEASMAVIADISDHRPDRLTAKMGKPVLRRRILKEVDPHARAVQTFQLVQNANGASTETKTSQQVIKARLRERRFRKQRNIEQCPVCFVDYQKNEMAQFASCGHLVCKLCLKQHIQISLKNFKVVNCPYENCSQFLEVQSPHIRTLNIKQQQNYYKATIFANLNTFDTELRLCPTENCIGFVNMDDELLVCAICQNNFCKKCMLPVHGGDCDENGVNFMQNNYLFRKCEKCKMVLQRNKGCDHMTCRCGYQFCYKCGAKWASQHKCAPLPPAPQIEPIPQIRPNSTISEIRSRISVNQSSVFIDFPDYLPNSPINRAPRNVPAPRTAPPPNPVPAPREVPAPNPVPAPREVAAPREVPAAPSLSQYQQAMVRPWSMSVALSNRHSAPIPNESSLALPIAAAIPAAANPSASSQMSCSYILKSILRVFVIMLISIVTLEFVLTLFVLIVIPILSLVVLLLSSFRQAVISLKNEYSCVRIVIGNIFIFMFQSIKHYCRQIKKFFTTTVWKRAWNQKYLFMLTHLIWNDLGNCLNISSHHL